jgi:hypothetical protein
MVARLQSFSQLFPRPSLWNQLQNLQSGMNGRFDRCNGDDGQEPGIAARVSPPSPAAPAAPGLSGIQREVHEMGREVQGLAARIGELEEKVTTTPPAATAPSAHTSPLADANEPEAGPTRLQEVLPEIKDLAGKVGGLEQLSDIVETLKQTKK